MALTLVLGYSARVADDVTVGTPLEGVHRIVFTDDSMTEYGDGPTGDIGIIRSRLASHSAPKAFELLDAGKANDVWLGFNGDPPRGVGWRGVPWDEFKRIVEQMAAPVQGGGVRVMLLSTTICSENLNSPQNTLLISYNQAPRDIAHRHGCLFVDLQPVFREYVSSYQATGARITRSQWAASTCTVLTALLSPMPRGIKSRGK